MVDAHNLDGVFQMSHSIEDSSLALLLEEAMEKGDMGDAVLCGKGTHLVVGEVSGNVAQCLGIAVAAHYRHTADVQCVVETLLTAVAQVDHYATAVHLLDDLLTELAHSVVCVTATGGVADVVVAVVAESDVDDTTLSEMLHVT